MQLDSIRQKPCRCLLLAPAQAFITYRFPANPALERLRERSIQLALFIGGVFSCPHPSAPQLSLSSTPIAPLCQSLTASCLQTSPRILTQPALSCAVRSLPGSLQVKCSFRHCSFPVSREASMASLPRCFTASLPHCPHSLRGPGPPPATYIYPSCHEAFCILPSFCCECVN